MSALIRVCIIADNSVVNVVEYQEMPDNPPPGFSDGHYFWVYALGTKVDGTPTREQFLDGYGANVIEQARFGRYIQELM